MTMPGEMPLAILNDKYVLIRPLGNGGFGEVYEAYAPRLDMKYAVKIVRSETEEKRRQAAREARLLAQHSKLLRFIPDVYDVWTEGDKTHLVLEYIEGPTLQERLDQSPLPWPADRVEGFLRTLLGQLDQLHAVGIVHRDLKPSNIKDHPARGYILLDFGIAKQSETYTVVKEVGTVEYAPLEQLTQGATTDARSDLYSLGATAYQLLTRQLPRPAYLREHARHDGQGEILVPPGRLVGGVPPALERALLALLALDPADRPADARAARALLDHADGDRVIAPPTPKRPAAPPPAPRPFAPAAGAAPTVALPARPDDGPATLRLAAASASAQIAPAPARAPSPLRLLAAAPLRLLARWRAIPPLALAYTGLWAIAGGATGWGAGLLAMSAAQGRPLHYPILGTLAGALIGAGARLVALPEGPHRDEALVATAGLYVGAMALVGALAGGLYIVFDPALGRQDGPVVLGAAFAPLLGAVAATLLRAFRERSVEPVRRFGTGAVLVAGGALLVGIAVGLVVGALLWLVPPGSASNLLSDCLVPGALGGGLVAAALGLYLGTATLLLREERVTSDE